MSYIESRKRGDKTYYYLTRNIRIGKDKWKKKRVYLGDEVPDKNSINKLKDKFSKEKKEKEEWVLAEDIPDLDLFFSQIWLSCFTNEFKHPSGKAYKKVTIIFKEYHMRFYYLKQDSYEVAENIVNKFIKNPNFTNKVNEKIITEADRLRKFSDSLPETNLSKINNKKIWEIYQKFDKIHTEYYQWAWIPVAVDMFHNNLTNKLKEYLKVKKVNEEKINEYFIILTQPTKKSLIQKEYEEFLRIAIKIQKNKRQKQLFKDIYKIFEEKDAAPFGLATHTKEYELALEKRIDEIIHKIDEDIHSEIGKYYMKYFYIKHMWLGKEGIYSFHHYLKEFVKFIGRESNAEKILKEKLEEQQELNKKRTELIKKLNIEDNWRILFDAFGDFMVTKIYRRYAQIYAIYRMQPLLDEIAKRLKITKMETRFMLTSEINKALNSKKIDKKELKKRTEFCVYVTEKNKEKIYTGKKAVNLAKLVETKKELDVKEFTGQTGCIGKATGKVRIIIRPLDMHKMKKGDILVSIATDPDIIPAMKKAAAIVTEQGGVTSHAAIVSREMNIPCVIGTKIATKVLKDGDLVEVDATKGTVKIIK